VIPRRLPLAALTLLACLLLAACGERKEPTGNAGATPRDVALLLDYLPNVDHAGLYAAQGGGQFERAGLDVKLQAPSDPASVLKVLAAGRADLAISYEPDLLLAREQGVKVMAVGALANRPLTSLMSVGKDAISDPKELRGKKVGTAGIPYQAAYLKTILKAAAVPQTTVQTINVGFNLTPAMLSHRVDATLGAFWNVEGVELERRKRKPVILHLEDLGVPTYDELVIVAREETVRNDGAMIRRFLQALARGTRALAANPDAGLDPLIAANPDLDRATQEAQLKATLPVLQAAAGKPYGWMQPSEWDRFARWMQGEGQLKDAMVVQRAFTNEFLPGQGI
jgi:putative hydroxymethylpyrimidine transport system substrate-binding protein